MEYRFISQIFKVLDVVVVANLNPLCLMHEATSTAFYYGIYKTDLSKNGSLNIVFADVEHYGVAFKKRAVEDHGPYF